jgi:hypothetical protein
VERFAGLMAGDVLDEERHAGQLPGARSVAWGSQVKLPSLGPGPFEAAVDDSVELCIDRLDPGDGGVDQLQRLDLTRPDERRQPHRVVVT